jgi:hypothetical protein
MRIWFALLAAPILALADQGIAYAAAGWACAHQQALAGHALHGIFFVACVAAAIAAGQLWRVQPRPAPAEEPSARRHFLAGIATASAALSALVILAMWIPNWLLSPCFS